MLFREVLFDEPHDFGSIWLGTRLKTSNYVAPTVNQKFFKIPRDFSSTLRLRIARGQVFIKTNRVRAVDINLGEHVKLNTVLRCTEFFNLALRSRFLLSELVTWKTENRQSFFTVLFV